MFKHFRDNSGQTISAETVIIFVLVVVAIMAMSVYVRRGVQARVRDAVIFTRDEADAALGGANVVTLQYEPYYVLSAAQVNQQSTDLSRIVVNGDFQRDSQQSRVMVTNSTQLAPKERD
jgi:hypothetical protein